MLPARPREAEGGRDAAGDREGESDNGEEKLEAEEERVPQRQGARPRDRDRENAPRSGHRQSWLDSFSAEPATEGAAPPHVQVETRISWAKGGWTAGWGPWG